MAMPRATGTSSTPGSGMRNGRAARSSRMASPPNANTSAAARSAQVNRQERATSGAANTGR